MASVAILGDNLSAVQIIGHRRGVWISATDKVCGGLSFPLEGEFPVTRSQYVEINLVISFKHDSSFPAL